MFTAINILFCFLVPGFFAMTAVTISLSSLRRHISRRQLVFATFVLVANIGSISVLFQDLYLGQSISILPFVLICFVFLFSIGQFAAASLLGAVGRLRQKLAC